MNHRLENDRVPGADFDEVTYADDTICFTSNTQVMNISIAEMEEAGFRYGPKLNKTKCEQMTAHPNTHIHFSDNTRVPKVRLATYLGCTVGVKTSSGEELSTRFADTVITMRKLDSFWRHSNCDVASKI